MNSWVGGVALSPGLSLGPVSLLSFSELRSADAPATLLFPRIPSPWLTQREQTAENAWS